MERGMKQPRDHENVKTTTSSGKVSTQGTSKQPNEPLITIDDTSDSGDDAATFSSIPESNADKKILTTTITNVESAQLALKEFMDVNGTIKDSTKLRVIAVLQMVSDLQQEIFTCIVKMMAAQRYLNLGNVESIVGNGNSENIRRQHQNSFLFLPDKNFFYFSFLLFYSVKFFHFSFWLHDVNPNS